MNKYTLRQSLILLLTATIWGVAFVAQSVGMEYVGPYTFNAVRTLIGGLVLLPCIILFKKIKDFVKAVHKVCAVFAKSCFLSFFVFLYFLGLHTWHVEVSRPGVYSEL